MRANQAYARIAGAQTAEALSARTGKWVHAPRMDATIDNLLPLCAIPWPSFSNLTFPDKNPSFHETRIAGLPVIDGQQTLGITDPLGGTTYISDTARPLPVRDAQEVLPGVTYDYDYFDFGIPATITPPPAAGQGQRRVAAQWRTALGRELARRRPGRGLGAESRCPAEVKPDSADHIGF